MWYSTVAVATNLHWSYRTVYQTFQLLIIHFNLFTTNDNILSDTKRYGEKLGKMKLQNCSVVHISFAYFKILSYPFLIANWLLLKRLKVTSLFCPPTIWLFLRHKNIDFFFNWFMQTNKPNWMNRIYNSIFNVSRTYHVIWTWYIRYNISIYCSKDIN